VFTISKKILYQNFSHAATKLHIFQISRTNNAVHRKISVKSHIAKFVYNARYTRKYMPICFESLVVSERAVAKGYTVRN
jgi:hypothetical protein